MRVVEVNTFGDPDVLKVVDKEIPSPGPGELVVEMKAIGVNPVETYIRAGTYPVLPQLPYIPGGNGAGIVHAIGAGVDNLIVGERVYVAARQGAYGEYCLCGADQAFHLPDTISFEEGAALGVPAATAYRALFIRGEGKGGQKVLIHGASGSVGMAAIQLGRSAGMQIVGTAGTDQGLELIRKLGVETAVSHHGDYTRELRDAAPGGYDLILEMLANRNLAMDLDLLGPGGKVVIIGSRGTIEIDPRATMGKETEIRGLALANSSPEETSQTHQGLRKAMEEGALKPHISCRMPMEEAARAHLQVMDAGNCGKIVLVP